MSKHVGKYVLLAFRDIPEHSFIKSGMEVGTDPCGWCGREGCKVQLTQARGGKSWAILSSCPYHYAKLSYARALQPTKSSPCTNVPIHCPICPETLSGQPRTIWKYNAMNHFISEHNPDGKELADIPPLFLVETFISSKEEQWMGIPEQTIKDWRLGDEHNIPDTDGIEEISENIKRDRAESVVSTQPCFL
jgi:hypothetical protein